MARQQIKCHGSEGRFEEVAAFIYGQYGRDVQYIADVAGGQGLLSRILNKKYNYSAEVIDPRGYTLKGVPSRQEEYAPPLSGYYDLVVGLHPDEATRAVVESALVKPILVVPCCNFWDRMVKLGAKELVDSICAYLREHRIAYDVVEFGFKGPKNIGIYTTR